MITSAISVGSNGRVSLAAGPTYGILLAILFSHAIVCSAATKVLARLNIFYVILNGQFSRAGGINSSAHVETIM
jgi:pheromone shutdown protein TraB